MMSDLLQIEIANMAMEAEVAGLTQREAELTEDLAPA